MFGGENGMEISKRESKKKKIDYKMFVCKRRYNGEDGWNSTVRVGDECIREDAPFYKIRDDGVLDKSKDREKFRRQRTQKETKKHDKNN